MSKEILPGRGMLTPAVQQKAKELLGSDISVRELRLMAYVQNCLMNDACVYRRHINDEEKEILDKWSDEGRITSAQFSRLCVTKEFWDAMNEILWIGYAGRHEFPIKESA